MIWPGLMRSPHQAHPQRQVKFWAGVCVVAYVMLGATVYWEMKTSVVHSQLFNALNSLTTFQVQSGPSSAIVYPSFGPYDARLGYTDLQDLVPVLEEQGFQIAAQSRSSWLLRRLMNWGFYAPYTEKPQTGLAIYDFMQQPIYEVQYPLRQYKVFEEIPPLLVRSIIYIENREMLDLESPTKNPSVEWGRLGKAIYQQVLAEFVDHARTSGGSTIPVQIEKYRHSPNGATPSPLEKLRQITSASLKAYRYDRDTTAFRYQRLTDYLNTVPLAAYPGHGEINGIGDGLWAWYDVPFEHANSVLRWDTKSLENDTLQEQARVYKQALSLFIAHRRPSYYLRKAVASLDQLTNLYLEQLAERGIISETLKAAAQQEPLVIRSKPPVIPRKSFVAQKAATATRVQLAQLLNKASLYDIDRLDLTVETTINEELQQGVSEFLTQLADSKFARQHGLNFRRTSVRADPSDVIISFTLHEKGKNGNYLRVQTDNYNQPFNINEGARVGLGSSAKLRVLIHYLDLIAEIRQRLTGLSEMELIMLDVPKRDRLTQWVADHLTREQEISLEAMLDLALDRRYSASAGERFFTGGGLHQFSNFSRVNSYRMTVRQAFTHSVNLVFIRLMRDIVEHYIADILKSSPDIFQDSDDPRRQHYLERFADYEGMIFIKQFYRKYREKPTDERVALLVKGTFQVPKRVAIVYRSLYPNAHFNSFSQFLDQSPHAVRLSEEQRRVLYDDYGADKFSLADRGYLSGIHPLELWLVSQLVADPDISCQELIEKSYGERQAAYAWLFRTRHKRAQDNRIRILLERDAFERIHEQWAKLAYPFDSLVPSYGTAIGSSADRPEALAELMGILVNDGIYYPRVSIRRLSFAKNTPYETTFEPRPQPGKRVLPPEVAHIVKQELQGVVENGTARQLAGAFKAFSGKSMGVGGKTGTGDNRFKIFGRQGQLLKSRAVDRTATFAFLIDDRFFGTISLYIAGEAADRFKFTSSLPVKILAELAPVLYPIVQESVASKPVEINQSNLEQL